MTHYYYGHALSNLAVRDIIVINGISYMVLSVTANLARVTTINGNEYTFINGDKND
jgi:hypothetical protein